jgi:hypothetical protein
MSLTWIAFRAAYHTIEAERDVTPTQQDYTRAWRRYQKTGVVEAISRRAPGSSSRTSARRQRASPKASPKTSPKASPKTSPKASPKQSPKKASPHSPPHSPPHSAGKKKTPPQLGSAPKGAPPRPPVVENLSATDADYDNLGTLQGYDAGEYLWYGREYLLLDASTRVKEGLPKGRSRAVFRVQVDSFKLRDAFGIPSLTGLSSKPHWTLIRDGRTLTVTVPSNASSASEVDVAGTSADAAALSARLEQDFGTGAPPLKLSEERSPAKSPPASPSTNIRATLKRLSELREA